MESRPLIQIQPKGNKTMDTLLRIIIALSFAGAAALAVWLLVEAADAVLRKKRGDDEDEDDFDGGFGY